MMDLLVVSISYYFQSKIICKSYFSALLLFFCSPSFASYESLKSFKITTTSNDTTISDDDLFFTDSESHDIVNGRSSSDFFKIFKPALLRLNHFRYYLDRKIV